MAIIYNPNKKIFTLHTAHTTYQMQSYHWDICCICTTEKNKQFHGLCLNL